MSYSWEDICDSQEFVHTQRFVEVEDYRTLEAQFQEQKKLVEKLKEALEFYANTDNWSRRESMFWESIDRADCKDFKGGTLARQVLEVV